MNNGRRKFLKFAGLTVLGIASEKLINNKTEGAPSKAMNKAAGTKSKLEAAKSGRKVRLAMVVDLRKCISERGCTKCIDACNKTHNIPDFGNSKDEVKWIWKEPYENTFIDQENFYMKDDLKKKQVPVFCNNCDNPPCVEVCPTQATWKSEDGIVKMDWHRCIGCRYCMAACPYGARSFNWKDPKPFIKNIHTDFPFRTKGVVEKCEFCEEKVSKGLIPSCVEACTEKALVFGNINDPDSDVRELLKENYSVRRKPGLGTGPEVYYLV